MKIEKHSKDIIDLVEIGDIVNGEKVIDKYLFNGDIKTILTKEILGNKLFLYRVR